MAHLTILTPPIFLRLLNMQSCPLVKMSPLRETGAAPFMEHDCRCKGAGDHVENFEHLFFNHHPPPKIGSFQMRSNVLQGAPQFSDDCGAFVKPQPLGEVAWDFWALARRRTALWTRKSSPPAHSAVHASAGAHCPQAVRWELTCMIVQAFAYKNSYAVAGWTHSQLVQRHTRHFSRHEEKGRSVS